MAQTRESKSWMFKTTWKASMKACLCNFPVAAQNLRDVRLLEAFFQRPAREFLGQLQSEKSFQRLAPGIHVDEDETAPAADFRLGKTPLRRFELRKIPLTRHVREGAIEVPREAVKRATKFARADAAVLTQQHTAMGGAPSDQPGWMRRGSAHATNDMPAMS